MFGEEVMGVQCHASLLPIGVYFDCEEVIEQESEPQINTGAIATPHTGTTKTRELNAK